MFRRGGKRLSMVCGQAPFMQATAPAASIAQKFVNAEVGGAASAGTSHSINPPFLHFIEHRDSLAAHLRSAAPETARPAGSEATSEATF